MGDKKDKKDSGIKIDAGGEVKGLEGILGGLGNIGKLVEAAKNLGNLTEEQRQRLEDASTLINANGSAEGLTEDQQERLANAKERLSKRGETVFNSDKLVGSHSLNIKIGGKSINDRSNSEGSFSERAPIKTFKKSPKKPEGVLTPKLPEPNIDIFHEDNGVYVTIELPGVKKEDIIVRAKGNMLDINVEGDRGYHKEIDVSPISDPENIVSTYNNGILSIKV